MTYFMRTLIFFLLLGLLSAISSTIKHEVPFIKDFTHKTIESVSSLNYLEQPNDFVQNQEPVELHLKHFQTNILLPASVPKDAWIRINIIKRTSFEILFATNKEKPAQTSFSKNVLLLDCDEIDLEGFNAEENVLKLEKKTDGEIYLSIFIVEPEIDLLENTTGGIDFEKRRTITSLSVKNLTSEDFCVEECSQTNGCDKSLRICNCSSNDRAKDSPIDNNIFYGRDCSKYSLIQYNKDYRHSVWLEANQQLTFVVAKSDIHEAVSMKVSSQNSFFVYYVSFGDSSEPAKYISKNLMFDDYVQNTEDTNKFDSNFYKVAKTLQIENFESEKMFVFLHIMTLDQFSYSYIVIDSELNYWMNWRNMIINGKILIIIMMIMLIVAGICLISKMLIDLYYSYLQIKIYNNVLGIEFRFTVNSYVDIEEELGRRTYVDIANIITDFDTDGKVTIDEQIQEKKVVEVDNMSTGYTSKQSNNPNGEEITWNQTHQRHGSNLSLKISPNSLTLDWETPDSVYKRRTFKNSADRRKRRRDRVSCRRISRKGSTTHGIAGNIPYCHSAAITIKDLKSPPPIPDGMCEKMKIILNQS